MSSRKMILIFALPLLAACADRDLVAPDEEGAVIQAAKGGNKGKPGDDGGGTWDGTQDIVYVESFSSKRRKQNENRLVVVNSDGSNRAIAYSRSGSLYWSRASLSADGNAIVFGDDGGVHIIRLLDPTTGSISSPELLVPGEIYAYTLELLPTSNVFMKGHCIRVHITSSNFPLWDRNPNTGHEQGLDAEIQVAEQIVYHSEKYPSHIVLPVIPNT